MQGELAAGLCFVQNVLGFLFGGQMGTVSRIIYSLVGIAGLWCITLLFRDNGRDGE